MSWQETFRQVMSRRGSESVDNGGMKDAMSVIIEIVLRRMPAL